MNNLELLPLWFIITYVILIGLCIGSFLNVVIIRGLKGESIVFERSRCPKCKNNLKWYMNIPLISYIFLRGKCAYCKCKISPQYPIVEFSCALLFLLAYLAFGISLKTLFMWVFFALFIVMSVTDLKETVIIDTHAYILLVFGLLYSFLGLGDCSILQAILGAVFGFIIFEIMARLGVLISGCRMFGEGDSLIALGLGAIFGYKALIIIIALSVLLQTLFAIPVLIIQSIKKKKISLALSYIFTTAAIILLMCVALELFELNNLSLIIVTLLLLWALWNILFEIRQKKNDTTKGEEEKFCLLPFGPALLVSATVCIFYLFQIKNFILDYLF